MAVKIRLRRMGAKKAPKRLTSTRRLEHAFNFQQRLYGIGRLGAIGKPLFRLLGINLDNRRVLFRSVAGGSKKGGKRRRNPFAGMGGMGMPPGGMPF